MTGSGNSSAIAGLTCKAMLQIGIAAGVVLYAVPAAGATATAAAMITGTAAAGVLGNAVHQALELSMNRIGRELQLAANIGDLPVNHDVAKAVRKAQLDAHVTTLTRYRKLVRADPNDFPRSSEKLMTAVERWIRREDREVSSAGFLRDMPMDQALSDIEAVITPLRSLSIEEVSNSLKQKASASALSELAAAIEMPIPDSYAIYFSDTESDESWIKAAHAFFFNILKTDQKVRTPLLFDLLEELKRSTTRVLEELAAARAQLEELASAHAAIFETKALIADLVAREATARSQPDEAIPFTSEYGLHRAWLLLREPLPKSAIRSADGRQYDAIVEIDTGDAEMRISTEALLDEYAAETARALRTLGIPRPNHEKTMKRFRANNGALTSMRVTAFDFAGPDALVNLIRSSASAGAVREGRRAGQLFDRLRESGFDLDFVVKSGTLTLRALLEDLKVHPTQQRLCFHLKDNTVFPSRIVDVMTRLVREAGLECQCDFIVSGVAEIIPVNTWPDGAIHWPSPRNDVPSEPEPGASPDIGQGWLFGADSKSALARLTAEFDGDTVQAALLTAASTGGFSADRLRSLTGADHRASLRLEDSLRAFFDQHDTAPRTWRSRALAALRTRPDTTAPGQSAPRLDLDLLEPSEAAARAVYGFVKTGDLSQLDTVLIHLLRRGSSPLRDLRSDLFLLSRSQRSLSEALREELMVRIDVIDAALTEDGQRSAIESFLTSWVNVNESKAPATAVSDAYYQLAFYRFADGDEEAARDSCELAIIAYDKNVRALNLLGQLELAKYIATAPPDRQHQSPPLSPRMATSLQPDDFLAPQLRTAVDHLQKAILQDSGYEFAHFNMGVAYEQAGLSAKAANCYIAALLIEPEFHEAMFNLSNVLIRERCFEDAARILSYGAAMHPLKEVEIGSTLAIALLNCGHPADGLQLLKNLQAKQPSAIIHFNLALCLTTRSQYPAARDWLDKIDLREVSDDLKGRIKDLCTILDNEIATGEDFDDRPEQTGRALGIRSQLLLDVFGEDGLRRNERIEKLVLMALAKPRKSPMHYAPDSVKRQVEFDKTIIPGKPRRNPTPKTSQGRVRTAPVRRPHYYQLPSYTGG